MQLPHCLGVRSRLLPTGEFVLHDRNYAVWPVTLLFFVMAFPMPLLLLWFGEEQGLWQWEPVLALLFISLTSIVGIVYSLWYCPLERVITFTPTKSFEVADNLVTCQRKWIYEYADFKNIEFKVNSRSESRPIKLVRIRAIPYGGRWPLTFNSTDLFISRGHRLYEETRTYFLVNELKLPVLWLEEDWEQY